jgi:hypothetical protein
LHLSYQSAIRVPSKRVAARDIVFHRENRQNDAGPARVARQAAKVKFTRRLQCVFRRRPVGGLDALQHA